VMTNEELAAVARSIFNPLPGEGVTVGSQSHFGSRIQPNSPGDDEEEILFSILEGLSLPTRYSVLSDIVKQTSARARAQVDAGFQSLAGTSTALSGMVGLNVDGLLDLARGFDGLYFETG